MTLRRYFQLETLLLCPRGTSTLRIGISLSWTLHCQQGPLVIMNELILYGYRLREKEKTKKKKCLSFLLTCFVQWPLVENQNDQEEALKHWVGLVLLVGGGKHRYIVVAIASSFGWWNIESWTDYRGREKIEELIIIYITITNNTKKGI